MRSESEYKGTKKNEIKSGGGMGFKSHPQSRIEGIEEKQGKCICFLS
jgi:hypothetical protein